MVLRALSLRSIGGTLGVIVVVVVVIFVFTRELSKCVVGKEEVESSVV